MYSEKERREKGKRKRDICVSHCRPGFLREKKERRKKENIKRRKGLLREPFAFKTVCWCNKAGTLNICLVVIY